MNAIEKKEELIYNCDEESDREIVIIKDMDCSHVCREIKKLEKSAANAIQPFYVEYFMLASSSPKSATIGQV